VTWAELGRSSWCAYVVDVGYPVEASTRPLWGELVGAAPLPASSQPGGEMEADVCVVGLGGSGLSAIGAALERGLRVVGVDASQLAAGATGRNGGFLLAGVARFHHRVVAELGRERACSLYRATLAEMDSIERAAPQWVRRGGSLRIALDEAELADCEEQLASMRADALPVEPYEGPEGSGLLFPLDGALQPAARAAALAEAARQRGAVLLEGVPALRVLPDAVVTPAGTLRCSHVLVCIDGPGLPALVPSLAGRVRCARLQMLATEPTDEVDLSRPVYARDGLDYWQQLPPEWDGGARRRRVLLGGCRDVGGDDEWSSDAVPTQAVQQALESLLRGRLGVEAPVSHRWAGVVGYSSSGLPIVGRAEEGVLVAGAYSGTGNVVGALAGRALVELAFDGAPQLAELLHGG
jgi:gamma-glutamylputrescine oxidase